MLIHTLYRIWLHHCCGPHMHRHIYDVTTAIDEQWWSTGRQKNSELHHQGGFLHDYYTFESMHDGDHDGVLRIFVGLPASWLSIKLINYITRHNFFPYQEFNHMEQFYYQECNKIRATIFETQSSKLVADC